MTLDGLTVEEWLRNQHDPASDATPSPHICLPDIAFATESPRSGLARSILVWCAAISSGAWLAVPVASRHVSCPPSGEGATACQLHHHVLATTMTFLLVAAAVVLVMRLLFALPAFVERVRREGLLPRPPSAASYADPLLVAANRGHVV